MLNRCAGALALSTAVLLGSTAAADGTAVTTLKALADAPLHFVNRPVTVTGRFRGRQPIAAGTTPAPLNRSRWDFLLNVDDAAIWVSGIRPAGWDFDLDPLSPADASRGPWLEVTGTVRIDRRAALRCAAAGSCQQVWIEASDLRPAAVTAAPGFQPLIRPALRVPTVVFHDPIDAESGVPCDTAVRMQFSGAIVPESLSGRIRISYASPGPLGAAGIPKFSAVYLQETRSVRIAFDEPLAGGQTVKIELLAGITAENGLQVQPLAYTFATAR